MARKGAGKGTGILSGVFTFVSREFDSFLANATGSSGPSSSRVLLDDEDYDSETSDISLHSQQKSPSPKRSRRPEKSRKNASPEPYTRPSRKELSIRQRDPDLPSDQDEPFRTDSHRVPSPPPLPRALKRRPSMIMPGSLFPRSPSMEPEHHCNTTTREQRVRFSSNTPKSPGTPAQISTTESPSAPRRRSNEGSSVRSAVDKFSVGEHDAGPSILLPSPKKSPLAVGTTQYINSRRAEQDLPSATSRKDKGKARAIDFSPMENPDSSGYLRVKGKERELVAAREELHEDERRRENHDEGESSFLEKAGRGRDSDKARIRMLEEEIARLKDELSRRPTTSNESHRIPPPPPPPPPPPKKLILPVGNSDPNLFASARASLKQAPNPVENPIVSTRRPGMPTIGIVGPDKMVAFLNEMKTVRLRKTSERSNSSMSNILPPPIPHLPLRLSHQRMPSSSSISRSHGRASDAETEQDSRTGEKRKRALSGSGEDFRSRLKRQSGVPSADSSFDTNSTANSSQNHNIPPDSSSQLSRSYAAPTAKFAIPNRSWKSSSITDAPTPSLCSDNDREEDASPEDRPPSTPPAPTGPSRLFYRFRGNGIPVEDTSSRNVDIEMGDVSRAISESRDEEASFVKRNSNVFDKRPPSSPFPTKSPRRPKAPGRVSRPAPPTSPRRRREEESGEEDPLSLSFSSPEDPLPRKKKASRETRPQSRQQPRHSPSESSRRSSQSRQRSTLRSSRRLTLDEELRTATPYRHRDGTASDDDILGLDSGVFTGVGTKSKRRGFLAHGGAGGSPVFMGVGYVEGAIDDDEEEREKSPSPRNHDDDDFEYLPPAPARRGLRRRS